MSDTRTPLQGKRRQRYTLGVVFPLLLVLLLLGTPTLAHASSYTPTSQLIFNDASGSRARRYIIQNTVVKVLDSAPRGATVKIATYWLDVMSVAQAIIRMDRRGVSVQLVTDRKHAHTKAVKAIQSAIKKNPHSKSSVFYRTHTTRLMHAKFVLVSQSGKAKRIAMWGSSNFSKDNAERNGNDFRIRVDSPNYNCLSREFDRLNNHKIRDITKGHTCESKGLLTQLTPASGDSLWITRGLSRINCKGGTKVRASSMQWSDVAVAQAFVRKQSEGCDVQLLVSASYRRTLRRVFDALKNDTPHGHVKVYIASAGHGIHYKWLAVQGNKQAWVMTGSLHPSKGSQHGVQLIVREDNKSLTSRYMKQFKVLTTPSRSDRRS